VICWNRIIEHHRDQWGLGLSHLSEDEIEKFLAARATPVEWRRASRHLLAGCGVCSRKLIEWAPDRLLDEAAESRRGRTSRDPLRDRTVAAALEQDSRWRPDDNKLQQSLELLAAHPQGYASLTFRQVQALHGKPLVEALLQKSWDIRFHDPKAMRWLAYNALKAAESLRPEEHAPAALHDLQARAWADLANAYKVNDEHAEAEAAFVRARALLRRGSGDLHLLAQIAWRESSLRSAQRRLTEARELLDGVYRLYLKLGSRSLAGQVLISKGLNTEYDDTHQQGVGLFKQGLALLDPDRDAQLVAVGRQGLIGALVGCGEYREASLLLLKSDLRQWFPGPRVRWTEGVLLGCLGQFIKAESALMTTRDEFLSRGHSLTAAYVNMYRIPILLQQGKYGDARKAALESYFIFRDHGIYHDAARAKRYLQ